MLNGGLAVWLIGSLANGPQLASTPPPDHTKVSPGPGQIAPARINRAGPRLENDGPAPPFHWSELESSSYPDYIAKLRAAGCPESVIRDVITADLAQVYAARARQIWTPTPREYWRKPRQSDADRPNPSQMKQLMALDRERQDVQRTLLGTTVRQQELIDLVFLQLHGAERSLAWLPEDRRSVALNTLEKAGYFAEEEEQQSKAPVGKTRASIEEGWKVQARLLQGVLTPAELQEFTMRSSMKASILRSELSFFDATQAEFDAILAMREKHDADSSLPVDVYARKAAECAAVREVLSEQRAQEYERATDLFYIWARHAGERFGLPEETASQAWAVKRETMAAADQVRRDPALSDADKRQRLTGLKQSAGAQLDEMLGTAASQYARQGDGAWLQILDQRTQP